MAYDYILEHSIKAGVDQIGVIPPRVDKAIVKKALSDLLAEIPAFRELMNLPGPSADGGTHGRRDSESTAPTGPFPRPGKCNLVTVPNPSLSPDGLWL